MKQLAVPLASVVPLQVWPANEKLKGTFTTSAPGLADTSASVPVIFNALFGLPLPGLEFRLRNVVCLPVVQVTRAKLEISACVPFVAAAIRVSWPVKIPV